MVANGLLTRQRYRQGPPRVDYELTPRSRELLPVLGALARWGRELSAAANSSGASRRAAAGFQWRSSTDAPKASFSRISRIAAAVRRAALQLSDAAIGDHTAVGTAVEPVGSNTFASPC
jgi:hypothetical protein